MELNDDQVMQFKLFGFVLIPGLFSAFGLLCADVEHHYSRTLCRVLQDTDPFELEAGWKSLEQQALDQLAKNGFQAHQTRLQRSASMHYQGQIYELSVPVPEGLIDQNIIDTLEMAFGDEHERTYGHRAGPGEPVELVNLELIGQGISKQSRVPDLLHIEETSQRESLARQVYFGPDRGWMDVPVVDRGWLNKATDGPCIIEEYDATCLLPPNARASLDERGNIVIDLQQLSP